MKPVETEQPDRHGRQVRRTKDPKWSCLMAGKAFVPRAVDSRSGFRVEPIIPRHSDAFGQQDALDRRCLRCRVICSVEWFVPSLTRTHPMTKPSGGGPNGC
jgi:hypothetical protein